MEVDITAAREMVPFPFLFKRIDACDCEISCPVNDLLKMAIRSKMDDITAMGMIYIESCELFPSLSVKPTNTFAFELESVELGQWIEKSLCDIPLGIKSLYFTYCEDESRDDEDSQTYSISLFGAESFDDDFEWIFDSRELSDYSFQSQTLDKLYQIKTEIKWDFEKVAFLENIILYSYGMLLTAKAFRFIGLKPMSRHNKKGLYIVFGVETGSEMVPYQALDLTDLL